MPLWYRSSSDRQISTPMRMMMIHSSDVDCSMGAAGGWSGGWDKGHAAVISGSDAGLDWAACVLACAAPAAQQYLRRVLALVKPHSGRVAATLLKQQPPLQPRPCLAVLENL